MTSIEQKDQTEQEDLRQIEAELTDVLDKEKRNWTKIYELMSRVEQEKLYEQKENCKSFTQWVNMLAKDLHVHASGLWAKLKAGRTYAAYVERAEKRGMIAQRAEDVAVSVDTINLCATIAGKSVERQDSLLDRAIRGELSRQDLREAARAKSAESARKYEKGLFNSEKKEEVQKVQNQQNPEEQQGITAADIIVALKSSSWIEYVEKSFERDEYITKVRKLYAEFPVYTGTSRSARRMDAVILENISARERDEIVIRGVEIKVSVSDLMHDEKMTEYTDFCDLFYIAIPAGDSELKKAVQAVMLPEWGLIEVSEGEENVYNYVAEVTIPAKKIQGVLRDRTLSTALIRFSML